MARFGAMTPTPLPPEERTRRRFAGFLWRLADLVQASDRRRSFRARAFKTAVWALDDLSVDLHDSDEEMTAVDGVGPGVVRLVDEFRATGTLSEYDRLAPRFPAESRRLGRLPRMTPARLEALKGVGVDTIADLLDAVYAGAAETVEGVGAATADRWSVVLSMPPTPGAVPAHDAAVAAARFRAHLTRHLDATVAVGGAVRRLDEWADRLELVVATDEPETAVRFLEQTAVAASSATEPGWGIELVGHDGLSTRVHLASPTTAGTVLVRSTGPGVHVEELGLGDQLHPTESDVYAAAGRAWVPPPARILPAGDARELVTMADLRGDLHLHSDWSPDGHMDLDSIVAEAAERGYAYVALTDHTIGLRFGGLDAADLRRQRALVDEVRARHPDVVLLHGAEVNIDRDGLPDLDEETLGWLDLVVAGCHSHFDLPRAEQTRRIVAAVRHPRVHVLAHPTGRRIGIRPGFDVDLAAVFQAAADTGTALEVNGHRDRMDLGAEFAAEAAAAGAVLAANGDAHRLPELDNVTVAVGVMQRAGLGAPPVVNTRSYEEFASWLGR